MWEVKTIGFYGTAFTSWYNHKNRTGDLDDLMNGWLKENLGWEPISIHHVGDYYYLSVRRPVKPILDNSNL